MNEEDRSFKYGQLGYGKFCSPLLIICFLPYKNSFSSYSSPYAGMFFKFWFIFLFIFLEITYAYYKFILKSFLFFKTDHLPFMGIKSSGIGSQGIAYSIEAMTRLKSTVINLW